MTPFPGSHDTLLRLYHDLVSPEVVLEDIICSRDITGGAVQFTKGSYNLYNKWNTTHGIAHLCAPPNSITAEIELAADATVRYRNGAREPVVDPGALICCAGYGGPDRNSDPTIGATVNAQARLGAMITLPNPVGLYMDHIDLSGWEGPDSLDVSACVKIVRGRPRMIERLVVEVPPETGCMLGDLTIGGEPIEFGGQIAECITVKLVGAAAKLGSTVNQPIPCVTKCCFDPAYATTLSRPISVHAPTPPGKIVAFEAQLGSAAPRALTLTRPMRSRPGRSVEMPV